MNVFLFEGVILAKNEDNVDSVAARKLAGRGFQTARNDLVTGRRRNASIFAA